MSAKRQLARIHYFYPYYLGEHRHPTNRMLHFIGTGSMLSTLVYVLVTQQWWYSVLLPVFGYGFAWFGHFFVERNKPATFTYPWLSFVCDFRMFFDILRRRI